MSFKKSPYAGQWMIRKIAQKNGEKCLGKGASLSRIGAEEEHRAWCIWKAERRRAHEGNTGVHMNRRKWDAGHGGFVWIKKLELEGHNLWTMSVLEGWIRLQWNLLDEEKKLELGIYVELPSLERISTTFAQRRGPRDEWDSTQVGREGFKVSRAWRWAPVAGSRRVTREGFGGVSRPGT